MSVWRAIQREKIRNRLKHNFWDIALGLHWVISRNNSHPQLFKRAEKELRIWHPHQSRMKGQRIHSRCNVLLSEASIGSIQPRTKVVVLHTALSDAMNGKKRHGANQASFLSLPNIAFGEISLMDDQFDKVHCLIPA